jgi:iron complex outermembrane receptor protein
MPHRFPLKETLLASAVAALFAAQPALAQTAAPADEPVSIVVTGTRVAARTALDTASPVDIISAEALKNVGVTEVNQALSVALPSLNFPRPA